MANLPSGPRGEPDPAPHRWIIKGELPMTRISGTALIAAIVLSAAPSISLAQNNAGAQAPGTNSAGTAQSSGPAPNREPGVTTGSAGMGSGKAAVNPPNDTDAVIGQENNTIDRKLKGICRGC
jgi:hypothetical protein